MRLPVNRALPLAIVLLGCVIGSGLQARPAQAVAETTGPAADYPVTVGEPFTVGGTTWTPVDQLNYDAVGQALVQDTLVGVSAANKTLPVPSYVEVTSLETGHTALVRIVERGPMVNETLIALSPQAATQLGLIGRGAVRVRRVNPPEVERSALRSGANVPNRMDTPETLLMVLRRKLAAQSPLVPPPSIPPKMPAVISPTDPDAALPRLSSDLIQALPSEAPKLSVGRAPRQEVVARPAPAREVASASTATPVAKGRSVVQVAAFSDAERARKVAAQLGGQVSQSGRFWRVRLGPFMGSGEASPALEKAKTAGYRDARIQRAD